MLDIAEPQLDNCYMSSKEETNVTKRRRPTTGRLNSRGDFGKTGAGSRMPKIEIEPGWEFRRVLLDGDVSQAAVLSGRATGGTLHSLRDIMGMTIGDVATIVGASSRTIIRKERSVEPLTPAETDRLYRIARIGDLAVTLIGDRAHALEWLKTNSRYLGGQTPLAMLETEIGTETVVESLYAIAYGGVA